MQKSVRYHISESDDQPVVQSKAVPPRLIAPETTSHLDLAAGTAPVQQKVNPASRMGRLMHPVTRRGSNAG